MVVEVMEVVAMGYDGDASGGVHHDDGGGGKNDDDDNVDRERTC